MPKVSVITAAYNHVQFIRQCVESVMNQTYRDFEHIVVDDGSTDGTSEVLRSFGDQIKYIRQENRGAHAAINVGIRASSGEYFATLDSDDAWLPNKLERQMRAFEQYPEVGLVYSQAYTIDAEGALTNNGEPMGKPFADSRRAFEELLRDNYIPVLTAVFRRACIEDVGFFSETLKALSDWDLWIRIAAKWSIIFVPESLALYRIHENNASHALVKSGRVRKERLLLLENAIAALSDKSTDSNKSRAIVKAIFRETAMRTAYGLWYRHQYSAAQAYLLFALRLHPMLLKDAVFAVRLRFLVKLLVGERGTKAVKSLKRLLT